MAVYANPHTKANVYRQQNAMTASPGELTLMLFDGCIKDVKLMRMFIEEENIQKANEASLKAQAIITELMRSLNMQYEVSNSLYPLYEFMLNELISANIQKKNLKTDVVLELLTELRDTWQQAVRINRQQVMGTGSSI